MRIHGLHTWPISMASSQLDGDGCCDDVHRDCAVHLWLASHAAPHFPIDLFVRVSNVFDRDYENFGLIGEDPDEVISTLDNDSPIFLGSGAPRAVWAGVKLSF